MIKNKKNANHKRSMALYLIILLGCALLLLLLAHFMQERAYAATAAQLLAFF